ncbi:hypothetical protein RF11_06723 [Thelohanellus kitauei]|uniref:Uncharacterized protein n=1 Tax=Thelohanellus kitauei TaxID=669202 RepID=A0A0C2N304_THEKT|nr:hypothetical protein RF11_06723 [Thelohanellus kitauei]
MSAFAIVTKSMVDIFVQPDDLHIIEKAFNLCFEVINHLKDNEMVCERTCDVLVFVVYASYGVYPENEKLSQQFILLYQYSQFSCFIRPFNSLIKICGKDACHWGWFLKNCKVIFDHGCTFVSDGNNTHRPRHVERLMKLLQSLIGFNIRILEHQYDEVLNHMNIEKLVPIASGGLLSQEELTFKECHKVLIELFTHPSTPILNLSPETKSMVVRLYNSYIGQIVKDFIEAILSPRKLSYIKGCGHMLHIMNNVELRGMGRRLKIEEMLVKEILKTYPDEINKDETIFENLTKILSASSQEEAADLAALINFELYGR